MEEMDYEMSGSTESARQPQPGHAEAFPYTVPSRCPFVAQQSYQPLPIPPYPHASADAYGLPSPPAYSQWMLGQRDIQIRRGGVYWPQYLYMAEASDQMRPHMLHQPPWPVSASVSSRPLPLPQEDLQSQQFRLQLQMLDRLNAARSALGQQGQHEQQQTQDQAQNGARSQVQPQVQPQVQQQQQSQHFAQEPAQASQARPAPYSTLNSASPEFRPASPPNSAHGESGGQQNHTQQLVTEQQGEEPGIQPGRQPGQQQQQQQAAPGGLLATPASSLSPGEETRPDAQRNRDSSWSSVYLDNWPTVSQQQQPTMQNTSRQSSQQSPWTGNTFAFHSTTAQNQPPSPPQPQATMSSWNNPNHVDTGDEDDIPFQDDGPLYEDAAGFLFNPRETDTRMPSAHPPSPPTTASLRPGNLPANPSAEPAASSSPAAPVSLRPSSVSSAPSATAATAAAATRGAVNASSSITAPSATNTMNATTAMIAAMATDTVRAAGASWTTNRSERRRHGRSSHRRLSTPNQPNPYYVSSSDEELEEPQSRNRGARSHQTAGVFDLNRDLMMDRWGEEGLQSFREAQARARVQSASQRAVDRMAMDILDRVEIESLDDDKKMCDICYNDFGTKTPEGHVEHPLRLRKCKHVFGDKCIKTWLQQSAKCPYCREYLLPDPRAHRYQHYSSTFLQDQRNRVLLATDTALGRQRSMTMSTMSLPLSSSGSSGNANNASNASNANNANNANNAGNVSNNRNNSNNNVCSNGTSSTNTAGRSATLGERRVAVPIDSEEESRRRVRRRHVSVQATQSRGTAPAAGFLGSPNGMVLSPYQAQFPQSLHPIYSYGNAFTLSSVGPGFSAFQPPPAAPTTQTPAAISLFGPNGRTHPPFYNGMQQQRSQQPSYPAATGTHNPTMSAFATPGVLPPPTTFASAQPSPSAGRPVYTSPFNQQIPPMASHSQHSSNMYARAAPGTTPGATPVSTADGATNTNTNANMSTQSSYPPPQGGSPSSQNNSAGNRNSMS